MAYLRYNDNRYGDLYEVYTDDTTGDFHSAVRHVDQVGRDSIYYDRLSEIPPVQRHAIEQLILSKKKE